MRVEDPPLQPSGYLGSNEPLIHLLIISNLLRQPCPCWWRPEHGLTLAVVWHGWGGCSWSCRRAAMTRWMQNHAVWQRPKKKTRAPAHLVKGSSIIYLRSHIQLRKHSHWKSAVVVVVSTKSVVCWCLNIRSSDYSSSSSSSRPERRLITDKDNEWNQWVEWCMLSLGVVLLISPSRCLTSELILSDRSPNMPQQPAKLEKRSCSPRQQKII